MIYISPWSMFFLRLNSLKCLVEMGGEVLTFLIEPDTIAESGVPTTSVTSHHRLFDSSPLMHSNICEYTGFSYEGSKLSINWSIISCEMLTSEQDGLTSQIVFSEPMVSTINVSCRAPQSPVIKGPENCNAYKGVVLAQFIALQIDKSSNLSSSLFLQPS